MLITGASGGIGADLARVFAGHGHDLALVARGADRLAALADEIAATGRPRPIVIVRDLTTTGAVDAVARAVTEADADVAILVNNAGYGLVGDVVTSNGVDQLGIVDLNIRVLCELTFRFLPAVRASRGKILNVGSIASVMPGPGMAIYYASKAFVGSFSRALAQELNRDGVTVTVLHPGLTATGFHTRAGIIGGITGATSMSVALAGYKALMAGRRVVVPGWGNTIGATVLPLIPDAVLLPLIHRIQNARVSTRKA